MSLDVSPKLLAEAERGQVREEVFVETVRTSQPYAYDLIAELAAELRLEVQEFADDHTPPSTEKERGSYSGRSPVTRSAAAWSGTPGPRRPS